MESKAREAWRDMPPVSSFVEVEIVFCVNQGQGNVPDADNIIKLILDALTGCVYDDDSQVSDIICRRRYFGLGLTTLNASPILIGRYQNPETFVYVRLTDSPIEERSLT